MFLVRILDAKKGQELARAALEEDGTVRVIDVSPTPNGVTLVDGHHFLPPSAAGERALALGLEASEAQLVAVESPSIPCTETVPCIAFRAAGKTYLMRSEEVFEVVPNGERIKGKEFARSSPARDAFLSKVAETDFVVSVGGEEFTVARKVNQ